MQISPDTMRLLMEMEAPADQKVALMKAMEADWLAYQAPTALNGINEERERLRNESTYAERKRAKDRERQRQLREIAKQSRDVAVGSRDIDGDPPATLGDSPATALAPTYVEDTSLPSLRSEGITPTLPSGAIPKGTATSKPKERRSRLVPEGWEIPAKVLTDLAVQGFTPGEIERELANFRNHEFRDPKSAWDLAFRTWMRNSRNFQPRKAHERPHNDQRQTARQANLATFERGADLAARLLREP